MLWEVALFPYANITILFGSAMKNLKNLASHMRLSCIQQESCQSGEFYQQSHIYQKSCHSPGLYPIFIHRTPLPG